MSPAFHHRVGRHALFWAAMLAFSLLIQLPAHWGHGTPLYVRGLFFNQLPASLLATYPLLYWLLPRLMRQRQPLAFTLLLAAWVAACVLLTMLSVVCFDFVVLPGLFHARPNPAFNQAGYWHLNYTFFITVLSAGIAATVKITREWETLRRRRQQLRQQRRRTELQLLKAQLRPAFLFGTLRALQRLTATKAPESAGAVLHLAELLRYMLYESPAEAVPLADEVAMLRRYVALEQLRLGARVEVSLSSSGPLEGSTVAPLLLLPLVENAFRHGTAPTLDCAWISIDVLVQRQELELKVINSQPPTAPGWTEGAGLRRLRQRLTHYCGGRCRLQLASEPDTFLAVLRLPLGPPAPAAAPALRPQAVSSFHPHPL